MEYDSDSELRATDTLRFDSDSEEENLPHQVTTDEAILQNVSPTVNITEGISTFLTAQTVDETPNASNNERKHLTGNRPTKMSKIIDSDSEDDYGGEDTKKQDEPLAESGDRTTMDRLKLLIDSDSDSNQQSVMPNYKPAKKIKKKKNTGTFESADSEFKDELNVLDGDMATKTKTKAKSKKHTGTKNRASPVNTAKNILAGLNLFFDDDEDVTIPDEIPRATNSLSEDESIVDNPKDKRPISKMTAVQAMEEKQIIQSESQRMARETYVDVPYHRTKTYSLEEFLARKTIRKPDPSRVSLGKSSDASIRMTSEQLEVFARQMKERELESQEFFKSESESSDGEPDKAGELHEEAVEATEPAAVHHKDTEDTPCVTQSETREEEMSLDASILCSKNIEPDPTVAPIAEHAHDPIDEIVNQTSEQMETLMETHKDAENTVKDATIDAEIKYDLISEAPEDTSIASKKSSLIARLNLPPCPRLSGSTDMLIDLESGVFEPKQPSGADILFQRLAKCSGGAHKSTLSKSEVSILSTDHGVVELNTVSLFAQDERPLVHKEPIPGAAFLKLKQTLKERIDRDRRAAMRKREEEYAKKLEMERAEMGCGTDEDEEEELEDEKSCESDNDEECDVAGQHKSVLNDEAEDADEEDDEEDEDESDETSENSSSLDLNDLTGFEPDEIILKKGRILIAFDDSDDEQNPGQIQELPIAETDLKAGFTQFDGKKDNEVTKELSCKHNEEHDENMRLLWKDDDKDEPQEDDDLMALCSGRFATQLQPDSTQMLTQLIDASHDDDQIHENEKENESPTKPLFTQAERSMGDSQLMELCSGRFETQLPAIDEEATHKERASMENSTRTAETLASSNSDKVNGGSLLLDSSDDERDRKVVARKSKKRRRMHITLTDDEDESTDHDTPAGLTAQDNAESDDAEIVEKEGEVDKDEAERYVDYDSEENEVEVRPTRKDKKLILANFVENEAELSESEWGSADEDEKDLDRYDIELADEEQFDQKQLQQELEKIHNRQMLDKDDREVEQLKEFFLEDEENDGVGRVRQFRWKNVEKTFSLDYDTQKEGDKDEEENNGEASDEETELVWRKMRHERNMLLKEQNIDLNKTDLSATTLLNPDAMAAASDMHENNLSVCNISAAAKRKITIVKRTTPVTAVKEDSPFLISKSSIVQGHKASFLSRDAETLNKLANLVKSNPETEGSNTVMAAKSRNFVFAAVSPAVAKASKRSLDPEDVEPKAGVKKAKTTSNGATPKRKMLLDSLM